MRIDNAMMWSVFRMPVFPVGSGDKEANNSSEINVVQKYQHFRYSNIINRQQRETGNFILHLRVSSTFRHADESTIHIVFAAPSILSTDAVECWSRSRITQNRFNNRNYFYLLAIFSSLHNDTGIRVSWMNNDDPSHLIHSVPRNRKSSSTRLCFRSFDVFNIFAGSNLCWHLTLPIHPPIRADNPPFQAGLHRSQKNKAQRPIAESLEQKCSNRNTGTNDSLFL